MSYPKASSPHRSGAGTPTKGGRIPAPSASAKSTSTGSGGASLRKELRLSHYPVQTLPFLQELLRPTAATRIAAAARTVHMEEAVAGATVSGGDVGRSTSGADSGSTSAMSAPPPPSYTATAAAAAAAGGAGTDGGGSVAPTGSKVVKAASSASSGSPAGTTPASSALFRSSPAAGTPSQLQPPQPTVPSLALLLECTTQLSAMLAQWRACSAMERRDAGGRPPHGAPPLPPPMPAAPLSPASANKKASLNKGQPGSAPQHPQQQLTRPPAAQVLQMMDVILWYCLATSDDVRLAHGGRSRGTSGRATPALPGTAATVAAGGNAAPPMGGSSTPYSTRGGRGGLSGGRASSVARSGSSSADTMGANDWLGSRMSSASSAVGVPAISISDDQLAEHLFRPAVDAVVLLQSSRVAPASQAASEGGRKEKGNAGGKSAASTQNVEKEIAEDASEELQTVALWLLAAVLVRFADAPFNASVFLPVLFPQVDVRGAKGASARHPLLQPLLRGDPSTQASRQSNNTSNTSLRCGAAAALTALLHKLQPTLQYAEEPHPNRQAFVSLTTQCGTVLLSLHESLCWGLESDGAARGLASSATPLLNTYAAVVAATPYNRCPRSRSVALQTLQLPVMRTYLAHEDSAEYVPTTVLISGVFKNESMRGAAAQLLSTSSSGHSSSKDGVVSSATPTMSTLLTALLQHADTRVEVWRCMVPLSRLYPRIVHSEFDLLLDASVLVVSALVSWEAAEEAAETAALQQKPPEEGERKNADPTTPRGQGEQQQQPGSVGGASLNTSPTRGAAVHRDPHGSDANAHPSSSAEAPPAVSTNDLSSSLFARVRSGPTTPPETLAECLRTWLHFMGYVWKSFDDNACDPALRPEGQHDRATLAQKQRIHAELLRPAMRLRRCGEEVRSMTLRCIAQIGDDYLSTILSDRSLGEELVDYVQTCLADPQPRVRGEALTALGMWLWQYPSMDAFACVAIDNAVHSLLVDPNALVRTKAAFALSNVTGRLPEGTCPTVRDSPDYIATLCTTALHAAVIDNESGVQGHGIRMMNHLLQVLDFEELISEASGFEEGVAEGFLRVLLECLRAATRGGGGGGGNNSNNTHRNSSAGGEASAGWYTAPREAKHRWNAACALGMGLARDDVFEAEPRYAVEAVEALCTAVVRDHIFKVRTQAAGALGRIPGNCLCATYSAEDLTPRVVSSLCEALETATSTENFRQYKEQGSLHEALRTALARMITTAKPSIELGKVFANYQSLLQKEQLL